MKAIETRQLTKDYGGGRGLFDLDLVVEARRVHGFLGPNGAGKTTALRLLMGFLQPTQGEARVLGLDPRTDAHRIRARVGYVPGELALPDRLRGREFLDQSAWLRGGVDEAWRDELVDRLGAELDPRIGTLSKGNKQKLALLDALQHRPRLLLMDEPTDGLDPLLRDQVRALLEEHVAGGGTAFLSSHVVHEIQTMCQDVSIVLGGRLRAQASIADLVAEEGLVVEATLTDPRRAAAALGERGASELRARGNRIRFRVRGDPLPALAALHALGAHETRLAQGDLEERFLRLYAGEQA